MAIVQVKSETRATNQIAVRGVNEDLARLLASENLVVRHESVPTASFDAKTRVLTLPIWDASADLYIMLVGHETGHALFTPAEGLGSAILSKPKSQQRAFQSYLNVVEDARIERKMKRKYPGLPAFMRKGYEEVLDKDLFELSKVKDIGTLGLIDRINIFCKVGTMVSVPFSATERPWVDRVNATVTFSDAVKVAEDLFALAKQEASQTAMSPVLFREDLNDDDSESGDPREAMEAGGDDGGSGQGEGQESEDDDGDPSEGDARKSDDADADADGKSDDAGEGDGSDGDDGETSDSKAASEDAGDDGDASDGKSDSPDGDGDADSDDSTGDASGDGKDGGTTDEEVAPAQTADAFDRGTEGLVNQNAQATPKYYRFGQFKADPYIIPWRQVQKDLAEMTADATSTEYGRENWQKIETDLDQFLAMIRPNISFLDQEYTLRKASRVHMLTSEHKQGTLDMTKLASYRTSDDIFTRYQIQPKGKKHGMVLLVDWSSSMQDQIMGCAQQIIQLVSFARKAQIPFHVYAFTESKAYDAIPVIKYEVGNLYPDPKTRLVEFFASDMPQSDFRTAVLNFWAICLSSQGWGYRRYNDAYTLRVIVPRGYGLVGSTPLDPALMIVSDKVKTFREAYKLDNVTLITLSDGGNNCNIQIATSDDTLQEVDISSSNNRYYPRENHVTCRRTRQQMSNTDSTALLLQVLRSELQIHTIGFYICDTVDSVVSRATTDISYRYRGYKRTEAIQAAKKQFMADGFLPGDMSGYDEYYFTRMIKVVAEKELKLNGTSKVTAGRLTKAFQKTLSNGKLDHKVLLRRFIAVLTKEMFAV